MARLGVQMPAWSWSYVTFRFGDGISTSLIPLAVVLHYGLPLWALALTLAAQNLAGVPAAFLWGSLMDRGIPRRPVVVAGFAMAGLGLLLMASLPAFPLFVLGAVLFTVFGVATAPAASTMILQRVPRKDWAAATGALSRRTGGAFMLGMVVSIALTLPGEWWRHAGAVGPWLLERNLVGSVHFAAQFSASAVLAAGGAFLAWQTIPPWQPPLPHEPGHDARLVRASQRTFDRTVFFPGRFRSLPSLRGLTAWAATPHRLWPLGYTLTFMGSICFFSSYPGVLHEEGFPAGLILLAQLPSHLVSPLSYPWAGRHGSRIGEAKGVFQGAILRTVTLPLFCATALWAGVAGYPLLLLFHGLMGLSFALIQVNGPVILAGLHPGGHGQGVGTYHAALGVGTLLGSLLAFLLLRVASVAVSYLFAVAIALIGFWCLSAARRSSPPAA